jgi:hypothetical protein
MLTSIACIERYLALLSIKAFNLHQLFNHASLGTILLRKYQLLNRTSLINLLFLWARRMMSGAAAAVVVPRCAGPCKP